MFQLSADSAYHFQILRAAAHAAYDGSDIAEVLYAANKIIPADFESFSGAFAKLSFTVYDRAKSILSKKFPVSARSAFFAAATYFRAADFYLHENPADPRILEYWGNQTAAFDAGLALLDTPNERVLVNAPHFDVPGIWFTPDEEVKQRPTIVMGNGYDGAQEEMYHAMGAAALERGYNVLTYEGPGQPSVRRYQELGFIHDWEKVVTPVVDWLLEEKSDSVDPDSLALIGFSFGGYLAPRVAAFEHRFAAIMAIEGTWDFGARIRIDFGPEAMAIYDAGNKTLFDSLAQQYFQPGAPTALRWGLGQGLWAFNTRSPYDFVTETLKYTLEDVVDKIKTPVFVGDAENDPEDYGQPKILADALGDLAYLYDFKEKEYIGEHCAIGSWVQQNQIVYDWFQELLDAKKH